MTRLLEISPQRPSKTSRRALTGRVALGGQGSVAFESSLERDWLEVLDFHPEVRGIQVQPFTLHYEVDGKRRRYTPDVAAEWGADGEPVQTVVYEVKPADELRQYWSDLRPRFVAATRYCRERGWRFKVVNEKHIRTPRLDAIRFLRPYRRLEADADIREELVTMLRTVGPISISGLLAATYWSDHNKAIALPYLWKMIAEGELRVNLDQKLTMSTKIEWE